MPACSALKHTTRVEVLGWWSRHTGDHHIRPRLHKMNRVEREQPLSECCETLWLPLLAPLGTPPNLSLTDKPHTSAQRVEHAGTAWGQMRYDDVASRTSFGQAGTVEGSSSPAHQCSQRRHSFHSCASPKPRGQFPVRSVVGAAGTLPNGRPHSLRGELA